MGTQERLRGSAFSYNPGPARWFITSIGCSFFSCTLGPGTLNLARHISKYDIFEALRVPTNNVTGMWSSAATHTGLENIFVGTVWGSLTERRPTGH